MAESGANTNVAPTIPGVKMRRVLVRVDAVYVHTVQVRIPAWRPHQGMSYSTEPFRKALGRDPRPRDYLFCYVNLGAAWASDLEPERWEAPPDVEKSWDDPTPEDKRGTAMTGDIEVRVTSPGNAPPSSTSYAIIAEYLHAADLLGLSYTIIRDGTNMTSRGAPTERWTLQLHVADDPRRVQPALKGEGEGSP